MNDQPRSVPLVLLVATLCVLAGLTSWFGLQRVRAFEATLPEARFEAVQPRERWADAARETLQTTAASDCWNGLIAARMLHAVHTGQQPPAMLQNLAPALRATRSEKLKTYWRLMAKLTDLNRRDVPADQWWTRIQGEVEALAARPPRLGLGDLIASTTASYQKLGLDPVAAGMLARSHRGYPLNSIVQMSDSLLATAAEKSPANAGILLQLQHNLLATWLQESNPFYARWLCAEKLAALLEADHPEQAQALRDWRARGRAAYETFPPSVLNLVSDPTPAAALQEQWTRTYAGVVWRQHVLLGVLPWCLIGLLTCWLAGRSVAGLVLGGLLAVLLSFSAVLLTPEMALYSFRLGYPVRETWPAFGTIAVVLGAVLPAAGLLLPGGGLLHRMARGGQCGAVVGAVLGVLLLFSAGTADNQRQAYLEPAGAFFAAPLEHLGPDLSVPSIPLRDSSE